MKHLLFKTWVLILFLISGLKSYSQPAVDSNLINRYLLDFVVPDMPAFKALDTDPSNILRPSDIKKFAMMISPFYSGGRGVIPKNFALEFAPWKIASKNWTLKDYSESGVKRLGYRSSFSLGTLTDSAEFSSKLSIGYRVSLISKRGDIYRAAEVADFIFAGKGTALTDFTALTNYWVNHIVTPSPNITDKPTYYQTHRSEFNLFLASINKYFINHPSLKPLYENLIKAINSANPEYNYSSDELKDLIQTYGKSIDAFIEDYKERNWNANRLDIAIAWVTQAGSTFLSDFKFSSFSTWITGALRLHKGGQLLLGISTVLPRSNSDSTRFNYSGNLRYYLGTQNFRGFLETQYEYKKFEQNEKSLLFNLGAEFRLGNNFWVVASTGIDNYLNEDKPINKLVSSIDFRYGFNK